MTFESASTLQIPTLYTVTAQVGQHAPAFAAPAAFPNESPAAPPRTVSLSDYAGRWLILVWYPNDFTFVCPTELTALSDRADAFEELDAALLGASTDSVFAHQAWMRTPRSENGVAGVSFPLLADTTHRIARSYGVLIESEGIALRGLFIVDPDGVLQGLQSGGLCPSDWKPGQRTIG